MTQDLRDSLRLRVDPDVDACLEAISRATGKSKQETAREVLKKWAYEQIHVSTLTLRLLPPKGTEGREEG